MPVLKIELYKSVMNIGSFTSNNTIDAAFCCVAFCYKARISKSMARWSRLYAVLLKGPRSDLEKKNQTVY